jgi:hypothetical protein
MQTKVFPGSHNLAPDSGVVVIQDFNAYSKISLILQSTKSVLLRLTYGLGGKEAWRPLNFS